MEDEAILDLFFVRSEQAIAELDGKYGGVCRALAGNILSDRRDAEECVNDAYLGAWNAIPPERPKPLLTWLCRVVRNLSLKRLARNSAVKRGGAYSVALAELEDCLPSWDTAAESLEAKELARIIEGFLDTLTAENRVIFLRRYWFSDPYGEIAARVGLTEKNISVRLTRVRKQLRDYLLERGVFV